LALDYITGGETVTAAKLNELWAEVDTIAGKALDNKSSLLVLDYTDRELFGQPFLFFTASAHGVGDWTTFSGAIGGGTSSTWQVSASPHDQNAKNAAAASATITSTDSEKFIAHTSDVLNLEASLTAHSRFVDNEELFLWEASKKHPEKIWNTAVAEIVIGNHSGRFLFHDVWDKFNTFRVHNLTMSSVEVIFGSPDDPTHSFTLEANSQRCVRRDSVSSGYDSTHRYVWKVKAGDPRFLTFTSHAGSVAQTMEASNVSNPSWLYKFFSQLETKTLISLDRDTFTDIGAAYQAAGYLPEITDDTIVGDLVYHRGTLTQDKDGTTTSITFNGFETLEDTLTAAGYTVDATGANFQINQDASSTVNTLSPISTNLATHNDETRTIDLVSGNQTLETSLSTPNGSGDGLLLSSGYRQVEPGGSTNLEYPAHTKTLGQLKSDIEGTIPMTANGLGYTNQVDSISSISISSTTEGAIAQWVEKWFTGPKHPDASINDGFELPLDAQINTDGRIEFKQAHHIAKVFSGGFAGWPNATHNNRIFEGPRKPRRHGERDDDGTHKDITGDPAGVSGADFIIEPIESITESSLQFQTTQLTPTVTSDTTVPVMLDDSATPIRLNLLKEHYNDLVTQCKKVTRIRALSFGQVQFGPIFLDFDPGGTIPSGGNVSGSNLDAKVYVSARDTYDGFDTTSGAATLWQSLGATLKTSADLPDSVYDLALREKSQANYFGPNQDAETVANLAALRYVTIDQAASVAAAHGFKFRAIGWFVSLDFQKSSGENTVSKFTQSSLGAYKATYVVRDYPVAPAIVGDLLKGPPPTVTGINLTGGVHPTYGTPLEPILFGASTQLDFFWRMESHNVTSERSAVGVKNITFVLYDTSVSVTDDIGKVTKEIVEDSTGFINNGDATVTEYAQGIHQINPSDDDERHRFCLELFPTEHELPRAVAKTAAQAESMRNRKAGLRQIIFKK
jgi:hypothetical protein